MTEGQFWGWFFGVAFFMFIGSLAHPIMGYIFAAVYTTIYIIMEFNSDL